LVPVIYNGEGAFGSRWETNVVMRNLSNFPVISIPDVARPMPEVPGGAPRPISAAFGNRPAGVVLFVPRGSDVAFTSHIRDVSRDAAQWGTEMPVVRERDTREKIIFSNVPSDPRYRLQLRIYGIDGVSVPLAVSAGPNAVHYLQLGGPCTETPCNSNEPAYASLDLGQRFPPFGLPNTIIVEQQLDQPRRLWAFITVTNNDTQHVTVISPQ
ncbi:MAG TPA: hypothetical protein VF266_19465, partial [Thermoanaerobaculia bacterium]